MAKQSSKRSKNGIVSFKIVVEKLQKISQSLSRKSNVVVSRECVNEDDHHYHHHHHNQMKKKVVLDLISPVAVAEAEEEVKDGHFAVVAVAGDDEPKRFLVPLGCLTDPMFLKLLEEAAEEYGFDHEGALTIPCHPCELEKILDEHCKLQTKRRHSAWGSSSKPIIQSY